MEKAGDFPIHVVIGAGNGIQSSVAWVADEVTAWEDARIARRGA
jgi:predicted DNA-binding transcriptional regulator AlpA